MRKFIALLFMILFFSSCSSQHLENNEPTITHTPIPTQIVSATATNTKTVPPTYTLSPTSTPTILPSPTNTPIPVSVKINASNVQNIELIKKIELFPDGVLQEARWHPSGRYLIVRTSHNLQVIDPVSLDALVTFPLYYPINFFDNGDLLLNDLDGFPHIFNFKNLEIESLPFILLTNESGLPYPHAISYDKTMLVTASEPNQLIFTDIENNISNELTYYLDENVKFSPRKLVFSPDNKLLYLMVDRYDKKTYILAFDLLSNQEIFEKKISSYSDIRLWSPDNRRLVLSPSDFVTLRVPETFDEWSSHPYWFNERLTQEESAFYSGRDFSFLSGSEQIGILYNGKISNHVDKTVSYVSTIFIYNTSSGKVERFINDIPDSSFSFGFSPNGEQFFTLSDDGYIRIWNAKDGSLIAESEPYQTSNFVAVSPDTRKLAFPIPQGYRILDSETYEVLQEGKIFQEARSPFVTYQNDEVISFGFYSDFRTQIDTYDISTNQLIKRYPELVGCIFNRTGNILICQTGDLKIFDAISGRTLLQFRQNAGNARHYSSISDDGKYTAYCTSGSETIFVWDNQRGTQVTYLRSENYPVCGLMDFNDSSTLLVSATGHIWNILGGEILNTIILPEGTVNSAYSKPIISPGDDFLIIYPNIYSIDSGNLLISLPESDQRIRDGYFDNAGKRLVIITENVIQHWNVLE